MTLVTTNSVVWVTFATHGALNFKKSDHVTLALAPSGIFLLLYANSRVSERHYRLKQ